MANVPTPINSSFLPSTCAAKMRDFGVERSGKNSIKSAVYNGKFINAQQRSVGLQIANSSKTKA
jgi:hypothetical protein